MDGRDRCGSRQVVTRPQRRPVVGEAAPEFALTDSDGNLWRSKDHHGQTVVVIFHRHIH
jgi:peroxiredoxin